MCQSRLLIGQIVYTVFGQKECSNGCGLEKKCLVVDHFNSNGGNNSVGKRSFLPNWIDHNVDFKVLR
ncbi:hypothetical protein VNO77_39729 [Canavalia gladiata]|uniref:Uncharacterized protein n=1 Tax=Canavalia gladiata TaxID=3824 RepID=A0AAN9K0P2_CANGL